MTCTVVYAYTTCKSSQGGKNAVNREWVYTWYCTSTYISLSPHSPYSVLTCVYFELAGAGSCITAMHIEVRRGHSQTNEIYRFGGSIESAESNISFHEAIHGFHGLYDSCISALGVYSILQDQGSCSENNTHCPAGKLL